MPSTYVIWNPKSGKAAIADAVREMLENHPEVVLYETKEGDDAVKLAQKAAEEGYRLIVAAGGDGTVNAVANGIAEAGGSANMGILPMGTANDFAFSLAIPDDLTQACELLFTDNLRAIDLVEIKTEGGRHFFANVAAGGNSQRVTESLTDEIKQTWGPLCYLRGALTVLADLGSYQGTVWFDDEPPVEVSLWNVLIANGKTNAGRLPVAPRARPDDGLLDVILIRDGTFVDLASLAAKFALSSYLDSDQVIYRQVKSLRLSTNPPMRFSIDGEAMEHPPVVFRIKEGAVKMIVGPGFDVVEETVDDPAGGGVGW